jgi:hypothetical protein
MQNILIIGDSHAQKLGYCISNVIINNQEKQKYVYSENNYISSLEESNKNYSIIKDSLYQYKNLKINLMVSGHPGRSALNFDYDNFASGTQKELSNLCNQKDFIVMPWLGYIDIKNWLPQKNLKNYKDVEKVVKIYVDNTLKKFNKARVIFIEPLPQFICFVTARWENFISDPGIEFEDRHEQHLLFIKLLKKYCLDLGLDQPISPSRILGVDMIEPYMQPKKPINLFLNDHMSQKYYEKILNHIVIKGII